MTVTPNNVTKSDPKTPFFAANGQTANGWVIEKQQRRQANQTNNNPNNTVYPKKHNASLSKTKKRCKIG